MTEMLFLIGVAIAIWIFSKLKSSKHPQRLNEFERELRKQADLRLYRNKDAATSNELNRLAEALKTAQLLVNESNELVRQSWSSIRPSVLHLTSEEVLKKIDLFYSDRQQEFKDAIYGLVRRLDKKELEH